MQADACRTGTVAPGESRGNGSGEGGKKAVVFSERTEAQRTTGAASSRKAIGDHVVLVSTALEATKMSGATADLDGLQLLIDEAGSRIRDRWED